MSENKYDTMQQVKKLISSVLISDPSKYISIAEFEDDYRLLVGSAVPYIKLGFSTLKKFLRSIPDVVQIQEKNGVVFIAPVVNKKVAHIKDLISKQKKSTSKKRVALKFIPSSVRNQKTVSQPLNKKRNHSLIQLDNRLTRDSKSVTSKKDPTDVNKLGDRGETKKLSYVEDITRQSIRDRDSPRVIEYYEEVRPNVAKCSISGGKEREKKSTEYKAHCSREVTNCSASNKSFSTSKVTRYPLTNNKAVIRKVTKLPVSEKESRTRKIVEPLQGIVDGITIKEEPSSDDSSAKIKKRITKITYEQLKARKGSSTEKEKAKSKERGRSNKKKSESGSSSSDSSRSSSESSSSSGSKSSSSSSSGSSSRSSSSSSDSSSSRNRNRARTKQRSQSKPISTRKSVEKDKKDKLKEKENDVSKDKEKDGKSKTASGSDKKSDAKHRSRSRSKSSHRKKRHRSPTPRPTKIHIGRLTRTVNREHIYEIFGAYGVIKNVEFPKDHVHSHIGRGYAYVEYANADEAEDAMKHMDGGQIDGQEITAAPVLIPKPRPYMPRRSPMPMRRPPMRRPPPHFRRRSPLRPRRSPIRRRPRSRNSPAKRRKRSRSSSSSSR